MREHQNIQELIKLAPDYIGFIFYRKSPRYAGNILTTETVSQIPENIKRTGVFVNESLKTILETCDKFALNTVQLHGNETTDLCRKIQNAGMEVIKAFSLKAAGDAEQTKPYTDNCDYFLFDTPTKAFGGSGQKFDWSSLLGTDIERPFFLSGGIEENDAKTIRADCPVQPYAVDINSRFETEPGIKNIKSVQRFINNLRKYK